MEIVLSLLGVILAIGLFLAGMAVEWKLKETEYARRQQTTAEQLTEAEKTRLKEEREAWQSLHNYSVEDAYGIPSARDAAKE